MKQRMWNATEHDWESASVMRQNIRKKNKGKNEKQDS